MKERKAEQRKRVWIPNPDEWQNADGEVWRIRYTDHVDEVDLCGTLLFTLRKAPVKTGEDAERVYDIREAIKEHQDDSHLVITEDDFNWMKSHLRQWACQVWDAPDAAFLLRWLENHVSKTDPSLNGAPVQGE